ncbi:hypothetical protein QBC38DRAFT_146005 [Podospora fimiseda]|uniref:Uncharacterized protein n=1 Tax=Podospora fimiseda TaxID=252190 RepID=A0AAN7C057_9PEZI|nr:hypothetical protein QBC38DRAFT_146005 [Podospora fimiseda]
MLGPDLRIGTLFDWTPVINPFSFLSDAEAKHLLSDELVFKEVRGAASFPNPAVYQRHLDLRSRFHELFLEGLSGRDVKSFVDATKWFFDRTTYSPLRLTLELGWEPTPRGAVPSPTSSGCTGGWIDAFEDLMRSSVGMEMRDLSEKEDEPKTWAGIDLNSVNVPGYHGPLRGWYKFFRSALGLSGAMWVEPYINMWNTPKTMEEWVQLRQSRAAKTDPVVLKARVERVMSDAEEALRKDIRRHEEMGFKLGSYSPTNIINDHLAKLERGDGVAEVYSHLRGEFTEILEYLKEKATRNGGSLDGKDQHMLGELGKVAEVIKGGEEVIRVSKGKVTKEEELGLVKETYTNEVRDKAGNVIASQVSTVWKDKSGRVVRSERRLAGSVLDFAFKPFLVEWLEFSLGTDTNDEKEQDKWNQGEEGKQESKKYKKWSFSK